MIHFAGVGGVGENGLPVHTAPSVSPGTLPISFHISSAMLRLTVSEILLEMLRLVPVLVLDMTLAVFAAAALAAVASAAANTRYGKAHRRSFAPMHVHGSVSKSHVLQALGAPFVP